MPKLNYDSRKELEDAKKFLQANAARADSLAKKDSQINGNDSASAKKIKVSLSKRHAL